MASSKWWSVNFYPSTNAGKCSVVLVEREGYRWHCEAHAKPKCRACNTRGRVTILDQFRGVPIEPEDIDGLLIELIKQVMPDRLWVDRDGAHHIFVTE